MLEVCRKYFEPYDDRERLEYKKYAWDVVSKSLVRTVTACFPNGRQQKCVTIPPDIMLTSTPPYPEGSHMHCIEGHHISKYKGYFARREVVRLGKQACARRLYRVNLCLGPRHTLKP